MVHLASPWSSYRSTIHPHLHFCLFLQISDVSQVSGPLWVMTVVFTVFVPLPPSCQPPMPNRPAVTSPELKLSTGGLFQADRRLHRKAAYLITHQSFLVLCFFLESDYKNVEGERSAEGMSCIGSCQGFLGLLKKAAALVETIP